MVVYKFVSVLVCTCLVESLILFYDYNFLAEAPLYMADFKYRV